MRGPEVPKSLLKTGLSDMLHKMYKKIIEHSVMSSPGIFLWEIPWINPAGWKGKVATTMPLNQLFKVVMIMIMPTAKSIVDFIFICESSLL